MSKYERYVWGLIYPDFTEQNEFDLKNLEDGIRTAHTTDPAQVADPGCNKCYGTGTVGTLNVNLDVDEKGKVFSKPITLESRVKREVTVKPLSCACARKFMKTALRLAEAHNNLI